MQTKVNSVAIRATNATGAGKTSTLKIGDKIIVTVTLSETVVVTGEPTYTISIIYKRAHFPLGRIPPRVNGLIR
jgi:hypothetical protein